MTQLFLFLKGLAMGAADVVPGVSGGTIAFITGIYQELIGSIKSVNGQALAKLFKGRFKEFWNHINGSFLIVLFTGIIVSFISLAKVVTYLLDNHPILVWSFFFGLIVASAWLIGKSVKKWNPVKILGLIAGSCIAYFITVISPAEANETYWYTFLSGAIAICAMILPGISGSFILVLMGQYKYVLEALSNLKLDVVLVFMSGCLVGILSFARLLSWMFKHQRELTVSILTGFMIGSLNKVWPWKVTVETAIDRHGEVIPVVQKSILPSHFEGEAHLTGAIILAALGFLLIWILDKYSPSAADSEE
jgi:putative membrane protein